MYGVTMIVSAGVLLIGTLLLKSADQITGSALRESLRLRSDLQSDPVGAIVNHCTHKGLHQASKYSFHCTSEILHRQPQSGPESHPARDRRHNGFTWIPATCNPPAGRPTYLEQVRFRKISVCCKIGPSRCIFAWQLVLKS